MAMDDEARQQAVKLLTINQRVLDARQRQKARFGDSADPAIDLDIAERTANIEALQAVLEPDPAPEVQAVIKRRIDDDYLFVFNSVVKLARRVTRVEAAIADIQQSAFADQQWRLNIGAAVEGLQHALGQIERKRRGGQLVNRVIQLATLLLIMAIAWRIL